ncbi:NlpC/P60 family protein [uncultured Brevundimonas sp.]|uniref:C40 family peptidase n=1 Tax=uncultured Brevundimonas sp. TaxID=213418 RepID=UPI0025F880A6|nr:NlpC/P60 family protein [uncultured Brevundimonas sp.]
MTATATSLDSRTTLARPDLAEQALEGVVRAKVFRSVRPMRCVVPVADIQAAAGPAEDPVDQIIYGEAFDVLDVQGDRAWGKARRDGVVGWIARTALEEGAPLVEAIVTSVSAHLPLNALVSGNDHGGGAAPIGVFAADPVDVAERLIGVPHVLGGRSSRGTDCCGLIQQALYACGLAAPRYADQQAELGQAVDAASARRGDLVIWLKAGETPWRGHSAFLLDGGRVLHATGHHGAVVIEPMSEAAARYADDGFSAPIFRRL